MSWVDRLLVASYISPSGITFNFQYENVSAEFDKKTTTFIFPNVDGALIQDMGAGESRYPLQVIFSGENYDLESRRFWNATQEIGTGTLIHPVYGIKKVVVTGTVKRRDDLVSAANQAIFDITFSENNIAITSDNIFSKIAEATNKIKSYVDRYCQYASFNFVKTFATLAAGELTAIRDSATQMFSDIMNQLSYTIGINDDYDSLLKLLDDSIVDTINDLGNKPANAINLLLSCLLISSQIPNYDVRNKMSIFDALINTKLKTKYQQKVSERERSINKNNFLLDKNYLYASVVSMCNSLAYNDLTSREEAIEINEKITNAFKESQNWIEENGREIEYSDEESDYNQVYEIYTQTKNYLITYAFNLSSINREILDEDRNILEFLSEKYGNLDKIDDFIALNNLTCDEIEMMKRGREVLYYDNAYS